MDSPKIHILLISNLFLYYFKVRQKSTDDEWTDFNELQALHFTLMRSLACVSHGIKGNYSNVKYIAVDAPLSQKIFSDVLPTDYKGQDSFKESVSVADLDCVFGQDWHIFNFENSTTHKRIIGNVLLHFRKKQVQVKKESNTVR